MTAAFGPLGATILEGGVNVAVFSHNATRVFFCLFDDTGEIEIRRVELTGRDGDIHAGFIEGIAENARYGLRADGPWRPDQGHLFDVNRLLVDPYARQIDRPFKYGSPRIPKGIVRKRPPPAQGLGKSPGVIYEIAVKAFTMRHPLVPSELRGTVGALGHPAAVDYLKRLGVDAVELMPLMAWIDERHLPPLGLSNAWGYNPITFMAPEPRLASGGFPEIRAAVSALHEAGICVLLDAVFNHTGETDRDGPTLSLRGLDNATYYRHREDDPGVLVNDTGCGNTIAADRPPVARLIIDAMRCWAQETGIDGFRFDLATVLGRSAHGFSRDAQLFRMIGEDPVLSRLTMIAEPWDAGPGGYQLGSFPAGWREWNDRFRDDVRRFWRGVGSIGAFATRLAGSSDIFETQGRLASSSVNYVAAHDGFTLRDLVTYLVKHNDANGEGNRDGTDQNFSWDAGTDEDRKNDVRALIATLLVGRGTPMLTAGDEFGRIQSGNNNAYAQDNDTTWLDWKHADQELIAFTSELISLRSRHLSLTGDRFLTGTASDGSGIPDARWLAADGGDMTAEKWRDPLAKTLGIALYEAGDRTSIWFNAGHEASPGWLPHARDGYAWRFVLGSRRPIDISSKTRFTLPPRSIAIFAEQPSIGVRRQAGDDVIVELAIAAGIQPVWWTIGGEENRVTPEIQRTLLAAMGVPATTAADARESLFKLRGQTNEGPAAPDAHCFLPPEMLRGEKFFGLMAHLYALRPALPSPVGDFAALREYCETAAREGANAAGINPLHHLFPDNRRRVSPYQPSDRRFIDPIYIDLRSLSLEFPAIVEKFNEHGEEIGALSRLKYIDYPAAWRIAAALLRSAFDAFEAEKPGTAWRAFLAFCAEQGDALDGHALYEAIGPNAKSIAPRSKEATAFAAQNQSAVLYQKWLQWVADRQMAAAVAGHRKIVYRDLAVGTALDGGEMWADPQLFASNVSMGAPPDPFSAKGQVWGLAPFRPHVLLERNLEPYADILRRNLRHAGWLRIDHALGLARQFWVPSGGEGADGAYVTYPLDALIAIVARESRAGECAIIAEDLGTVPEGLREQLSAARMLSYKVLWFEREDTRFKPPESYQYLSASCLGSHDLPTLRARLRGDHLRLDRKLGRDNADGAHEAELNALRLAMEMSGIPAGQSEDANDAAVHEFLALSGSALALLQADDLFGEIEPLNVPGTDLEYPNWRRRLGHRIGDIGKTPLSRSILERVRNYRGGGEPQ